MRGSTSCAAKPRPEFSPLSRLGCYKVRGRLPSVLPIEYVDPTAKEHVGYYYRLEEVSFSGVQQPVATRRLRGHVSAANRHLTTFGSLKKSDG